MKKLIIGIVILGLLAGGMVLVTRPVFAQTETPPTTPGYGQGMMGGAGRGRMGGGMMGGFAGTQDGPLHEYIVTAVAEQSGISVEALTAALSEGVTLGQALEDNGVAVEEIPALVQAAHAAALEAAVADGVVTAEQAEWMQNRGQRMQGGRGMNGACPFATQP